MERNAIAIELEKDDYAGGETVRGICRVRLEDSLPVRGVRVRCHGFERSHWSHGSGKSRHTHGETRTLFDERITVFGKEPLGFFEAIGDAVAGVFSPERYERLRGGEHEFPFEYALPAGLPADFESGGANRIAYEITGEVDLPIKFDLSATRTIAVHEPFDPRAVAPTAAGEDKTFLFGPSEPLRLRVALDRDTFFPGDEARCEIGIESPPGRRVDAVNVDLRRNMHLRAGKSSTTIPEETRIAELAAPPIEPGSMTRLLIPAPLPADLYASIETSELVRVEYELVVTLDIPWAIDLHVEVPIRIAELAGAPSGRRPA